MSQKQDYYEVLGLEKSASLDDIKRAYQKIVMKNHPDRVNNNPKLTPQDKEAAAEKFRLATEAHGVLTDTAKRQTYDSYGFKGLENLASGKSAGTGRSYTDAAGPATRRGPVTEEGVFDFFEKRRDAAERRGESFGDAPPVDRRASAEERARQRAERRAGIFTPAPSQAPAQTTTQAPASTPAPQRSEAPVSTPFERAASKVGEAVDNLQQQGGASIPLDKLEAFRENLRDFMQVVDQAIAQARRNNPRP